MPLEIAAHILHLASIGWVKICVVGFFSASDGGHWRLRLGVCARLGDGALWPSRPGRLRKLLGDFACLWFAWAIHEKNAGTLF